MMTPTEQPIATFHTRRGYLGGLFLFSACLTIIFGYLSATAILLSDRPIGALVFFGVVLNFGTIGAYQLQRLVRGGVVALFADGFTYRQHTTAWSDIEGVAFPNPALVVQLPSHAHPAVVVGGRRLLVIDPYFAYQDVARLLNLIIDHTLHAKAPIYRAILQGGQAINCDTLTLTAEEVRVGDTTLRRADITGLMVMNRSTVLDTAHESLTFDHHSPQASIIAAYIGREWLPPLPPTDLNDSTPPQLPLEVKQRGRILRLDESGLTVTHKAREAQHYPLSTLAYVRNKGLSATILSNGEPVVTHTDLQLHITLTEALAQLHYPTYRQRLAMGESIRFGQVQLWADRLTYLPTNHTLYRRDVRLVMVGDDGFEFIGFDWLPLLHIPRADLHNPPLFGDCLDISGGWGSDICYFV